MTRTNKYSPEVRERAVRMVVEHLDDYSSEWAAITSVSAKLGMTPETLRVWVRRAQIDGGLRPGLSTDERKRMKELEKENRDLRRANEILKDASIFFATELDGRTKR
jgi:transposase